MLGNDAEVMKYSFFVMQAAYPKHGLNSGRPLSTLRFPSFAEGERQELVPGDRMDGCMYTPPPHFRQAGLLPGERT